MRKYKIIEKTRNLFKMFCYWQIVKKYAKKYFFLTLKNINF